jgi:hypothetical protein
MDGVTFQVVEQVCEESTQLAELSPTELDQVGGGLSDPGIIDIDK